MTEQGTAWLRRRSALLTGIAVSLAALAVVAAFVYLDPAENDTWVNLIIGVLVAGAPLATTTALTRQRLLIAALAWTTTGLPGGYVFGSPVFLAGVLLAAALAIDAVIGRRSVNSSAGAAHGQLNERLQ